MDKNEKRHKKGIDRLVARLSKKNYDAIFTNCMYSSGPMSGELDVLAIRGNMAHYYEVKIRKNFSSYKHSLSQIDRVQRAFPNFVIRGIYCPMNSKPERI